MVHNFGIFDLKDQIKARENVHYHAWARLIERCYSEKSLKRFPQYLEVTICKEWQFFSNFYNWSLKNYIQDYHLDKDIIDPQNKEYGPLTCAYVPQEVNKCILDSFGSRGALPLGVWYKLPSNRMINERSKPYISQIGSKKLGQYATPEEAHKTWQIAKIAKL